MKVFNLSQSMMEKGAPKSLNAISFVIYEKKILNICNRALCYNMLWWSSVISELHKSQNFVKDNTRNISAKFPFI